MRARRGQPRLGDGLRVIALVRPLLPAPVLADPFLAAFALEEPRLPARSPMFGIEAPRDELMDAAELVLREDVLQAELHESVLGVT